jgi:hypothetical protein
MNIILVGRKVTTMKVINKKENKWWLGLTTQITGCLSTAFVILFSRQRIIKESVWWGRVSLSQKSVF